MPFSHPCSDPRCSAAHDDGDIDTWLAREDARTEAVINNTAGWCKPSSAAAPGDPTSRTRWGSGA
jgi:hypothetical protein